MEDGVAEAESSLPGAKGAEVVGGLGHDVGKELYGDPSQRFSVSSNAEEHHGVPLLGMLQRPGQLAAVRLGQAVHAFLELPPEVFCQLRSLELRSQLLNLSASLCREGINEIKRNILSNHSSFSGLIMALAWSKVLHRFSRCTINKVNMS